MELILRVMNAERETGIGLIRERWNTWVVI